MLDEPPRLTLKRRFQRPTNQQVAALENTPTGFIADAMGGRAAMSHRIKPVDERFARFCGVAIPCHTGPADILAFYGALDMAAQGDVIVIATDAFTGTAVIGDLALQTAKNRGVAAVVTDGLIRDMEGIRDVGLPCFAAGVTPDSPARSGPGTAGLPVTLGGVTVSPGDILVGDLDGVVVIAKTQIDAVISALPGVRDAEAQAEESVNAGLTMPDFAQKILDSDQVRIIDEE